MQSLISSARISLLAGLLCLAMGACSGSSDDSTPESADYLGYWDVQYNMIRDENSTACGFLVSPSVQGFSDQHEIGEDEDGIYIESLAGMISASGEIMDNSSLRFEEYLAGELFGDGFFCEAFISVTYSDLSDNKATSMYSLAIICEDGWTCEDDAVGAASRRI